MSVSCDLLVRFIPVNGMDYLFFSFFGFVFLSLEKNAVQLATTGNCEVTCSVHIYVQLKPHLPQVAQARNISQLFLEPEWAVSQ